MGVGMYSGVKATGVMPKNPKIPSGAIPRQMSFGQKLFLSEDFGITSPYIGNKVTLIPVSKMNVPQRFMKIGWSTRTANGGGMQIRIGIGMSGNNPNIAWKHIYVPKTFVPNSFANPSIQVKLSLQKLSKK